MPLRLECFTTQGCSAQPGFTFGPRDSNGHTINFDGTSSITVPMVDSLGATIGTCKSDKAPYGDIYCTASTAFKVPHLGWIGTTSSITYTLFSKTGAGEPLAGDSWSAAGGGVGVGNVPTNDMQLVMTPPKPDPIGVYLDPTAVAFAAGQAPQSDQVGLICASEAFCDLPVGVTVRASIGPVGMQFPAHSGVDVTVYGLDVAFRCRWSGAPGKPATAVSCSVAAPTVISHYGSAVINLYMAARPGSWPETKDYRLTLSRGPGASGPGEYSDLTIVAPLHIVTPSPLSSGKVGHAYSVSLQASGGVAASGGAGPPTVHHTWSIASGRLPDGLRLQNGVISGTAARTGTASFLLRVGDGMGDHVERAMSITITS